METSIELRSRSQIIYEPYKITNHASGMLMLILLLLYKSTFYNLYVLGFNFLLVDLLHQSPINIVIQCHHFFFHINCPQVQSWGTIFVWHLHGNEISGLTDILPKLEKSVCEQRNLLWEESKMATLWKRNITFKGITDHFQPVLCHELPDYIQI